MSVLLTPQSKKDTKVEARIRARAYKNIVKNVVGTLPKKIKSSASYQSDFKAIDFISPEVSILNRLNDLEEEKINGAEYVVNYDKVEHILSRAVDGKVFEYKVEGKKQLRLLEAFLGTKKYIPTNYLTGVSECEDDSATRKMVGGLRGKISNALKIDALFIENSRGSGYRLNKKIYIKKLK